VKPRVTEALSLSIKKVLPWVRERVCATRNKPAEAEVWRGCLASGFKGSPGFVVVNSLSRPQGLRSKVCLKTNKPVTLACSRVRNSCTKPVPLALAPKLFVKTIVRKPCY